MYSMGSCPNGDFLCGVVEGFYGRPWTTEQRKDLFQKMKKWGMDSYLYAPKDDYKHRAYWRELYTVEEAEHLSSLIDVAKENSIRFIYAISPGLDITYSSPKDVGYLKRKLKQVNQLGCSAFAILFDDIDSEMTKADKEVFKSFAHAQVSVTNEIFQEINVSKFLFCPTQYCASRATPNVRASEYLKTVGSKLDLGIDIMWTGPKVISKDVTIESIDEVAEVLRRPPVIWDNLHANDYDQKRLFLGPYAGRSPQLIPRLRGVLTNPNCEYGANFVAIHTLAQWSRCSVDAQKKIQESMHADAKLEAQNDDGDMPHIPENLDPHVYHPVVALKAALKEWLEEFHRAKSVWGPIVKPQILTATLPLLPLLNSAVNSDSSIQSKDVLSPGPLTISDISLFPACSVRELTSVIQQQIGVNPLVPTIPVMNSLAEANKVKIVCSDSIQSITMSSCSTTTSLNSIPTTLSESLHELPGSLRKGIKTADSITSSSSGLEPMDTVTPPSPSPSDKMIVGSVTDLVAKASSEDVLMTDRTLRDTPLPEEGVESFATDNYLCNQPVASVSSQMQVELEDEAAEKYIPDIPSNSLTVEDLHLLCDLFYLPFEHGSQGLLILNEFQWLKTNSHIVAGITTRDKEKPEVAEWYERAVKFEELTSSLNRLLTRLNLISNRELLYELYPYMWDMRGVVSLLNSYIKWLAMGQIPSTVTSYVHGNYTWFSKGWRESFSSGEQEPWVIRGGLTAELQRLIPVDRGTDLYMYKAPEVPSSRTYTIRNYRLSDESAVYKVCTAIFKDGLCAAEDCINLPKLPGDMSLGGFLSLNSDLSFVVEDDNEIIVGIAACAINGREFRRNLNKTWVPILREKYSLSSTVPQTDYLRDVLGLLHSDISELPDEMVVSHPAELRVALVASLADQSVSKRLLTCVLAALRANGIFGCFVEVPTSDKYFVEFYKKLGFTELYPHFLGRSF